MIYRKRVLSILCPAEGHIDMAEKQVALLTQHLFSLPLVAEAPVFSWAHDHLFKKNFF